MEWKDAEQRARAELDALGLEDWAVVRDRAIVRMGQCRHMLREVGLSGGYVELNDWDEVRTTVLHEAAHALVGPGHHHDQVWKRQAVALGVSPTACGGSEARMPKGPLAILCSSCGVIGYRVRRPRAYQRHVHTVCGERVTFVPRELVG